MNDVPDLALQNVYTGPDGNLSMHEAVLDIASAALTDRYFVAPLPRGMRIYDVTAVVVTGNPLTLSLIHI